MQGKVSGPGKEVDATYAPTSTVHQVLWTTIGKRGGGHTLLGIDRDNSSVVSNTHFLEGARRITGRGPRDGNVPARKSSRGPSASGRHKTPRPFWVWPIRRSRTSVSGGIRMRVHDVRLRSGLCFTTAENGRNNQKAASVTFSTAKSADCIKYTSGGNEVLVYQQR